MRKKDRHRLIIRLLNEFAIEKQEDFVDLFYALRYPFQIYFYS